MKLRLPAILLFLFVPGHWRTPLHVSAPLCLPPQKNQPHWLASSTSSSASLTSTALFLPATLFPPRLAPFSCLFKLQVTSNPA